MSFSAGREPLSGRPGKANRGAVVLLAECYANECFAEKLGGFMAELGVSVEVKHSPTYGRDRIVHSLLERHRGSRYVVGVIDYERGVSRVFIDKQFDLKEVESGILFGVAKERRNVFAVIFDPDIEEALICRKRSDICRSPSEIRKVKSSEACTAISRILDDEEVKRLTNSIAKLLIEELGIVSDVRALQGGGTSQSAEQA